MSLQIQTLTLPLSQSQHYINESYEKRSRPLTGCYSNRSVLEPLVLSSFTSVCESDKTNRESALDINASSTAFRIARASAIMAESYLLESLKLWNLPCSLPLKTPAIPQFRVDASQAASTKHTSFSFSKVGSDGGHAARLHADEATTAWADCH